jgi:cytoskeletal protein RodZ
MTGRTKIMVLLTGIAILVVGIAGGAWAANRNDDSHATAALVESGTEAPAPTPTASGNPPPVSTTAPRPEPSPTTPATPNAPQPTPTPNHPTPTPVPPPSSTSVPTPAPTQPSVVVPDGVSYQQLVRVSGSGGNVVVQIGDTLFDIAANAIVKGSDGNQVDLLAWAGAHAGVSPENPLLVEVTLANGVITTIQNQ